jgi:hypothetical protein
LECFDHADIELLFASRTNRRAVEAREQIARAIPVTGFGILTTGPRRANRRPARRPGLAAW